jgi:hypothetical protein
MPIKPERTRRPLSARTPLFSAFGLLLEVDPNIDIPGVSLGGGVPGAGSGSAAAPLVRVRLAAEEVEQRWSSSSGASRRMRELRHRGSVMLSVDLAESAGYLLRVEGMGRVLITTDGSELLCDPLPENPDWPFMLPAQALPLAATLLGRETFHAAGVVVGAGAALLAGDPGAGKSSLAAAFVRRGASLLGDDSVVIEQRDGKLLAHPGVGALYLRPPEHDRLSAQERSLLGSPEPFAGRRRYTSGVVGSATPFAALYLLGRSSEGPVIEHVENGDPFALLAATFNLSVRTPERLTRQLDIVGAMIATDRIFRLHILPGMDATQLADLVERHLAGIAG